MKIIAEVMPRAWITKAKFLALSGATPRARTRTGNEMAPPPIGVEPATSDPTIMTRAIRHCRRTAGKRPKPKTKTAHTTRNAQTYAYHHRIGGKRACFLVTATVIFAFLSAGYCVVCGGNSVLQSLMNFVLLRPIEAMRRSRASP